MGKWFKNNAEAIGRTPLVQINKLSKDSKATILAKIEGRNPAYSVKDRIGVSLIKDALDKGILGEGKEIIEATSGNTGIALSYVAASLGIPITIVMPDTMSIERRKLVAAFGAKLILTEGAKGMKGAIAKAHELVENDSKYVLLGQFDNPANVKIHQETTGPEIWQDTDGKVDIVVAGVGTGGTITGIGKYIKQDQNKAIQLIAVEPADSPVISQTLNNEEIKTGPHKIQGLGAGFIPKILDLSLLDGVEKVSNEDAVKYARLLASEEGIISGISSGAAIAAALRIANKPENEGKVIVVILPDSGERYLSSILFADLFDENGLSK
ncbi:cysteine synthase A [Brackiella oedipodis]|uniref:cysteine synthase A n=1 Tax=Brackiella oedipodis TaxID=124225 RepID=UPI000490A451|nr:cysteine synthase A [Brackiella oedipodis]